jgi:transposase
VSALKCSWSPRGQTPTARTSLNHRQRLNLFGALLVSPRLCNIRLTVRSFQCNLSSQQTILFLNQLLSRISSPIVLVWDNHRIHLSPPVKEFIINHPRLHDFQFPSCAPELNPLEFVWTQVSEYSAGFAPHNMQELDNRIRSGISRTRSSKRRLIACLKVSGLSWK